MKKPLTCDRHKKGHPGAENKEGTGSPFILPPLRSKPVGFITWCVPDRLLDSSRQRGLLAHYHNHRNTHCSSEHLVLTHPHRFVRAISSASLAGFITRLGRRCKVVVPGSLRPRGPLTPTGPIRSPIWRSAPHRITFYMNALILLLLLALKGV